MSLFIIAATALFVSSCSEDNAGAAPAPSPSLPEIIALTPDYSFLNAAITRANLGAALAGPNLTVFAPDNSAFKASGINDIAAINAIPVATLQSILTYHVIGRRVSAAQLPVADSIKTLNLQNLYASKNVNGAFVNGIRILRTDLQGSNGYLHTISKVLMPPAATKSIANVVANDTTFSFLLQAVTKLNLVTLLSNPNKLTVFAPTNAAFRAAGITDINAIPTATLDAIVKSHVLGNNVFLSDFVNNISVQSLNPAKSVTITTSPLFAVKTTGSAQPLSTIALFDIVATNGVIHVINRVLLP